MRNSSFRFKQFTVVNEKSSMKLGTDGVLLGAWCDIKDATRALDVGTGCGVIALQIAQRNSQAKIDAIDIDVGSIYEATTNFKNSKWSERLNAQLIDFNFLCNKASNVYDLIVSNPPYFTNGVLPANKGRLISRHTNTLTYKQLITGSMKLLTTQGRLAIISPVENEQEINEICAFNNINISKQTFVLTRIDKQPSRILWEFVQDKVDFVRNRIIIEDAPMKYTQEYVTLMRDFYLKF